MRKPKVSREYLSHNCASVVKGGKPYFDLLLKLISESEDTILLQVYIFDEDETGRKVAEALKDASRRKVKVYFLADGYASQSLSKAFIKDLKDSGIHFRYFEPFFRSSHFYFGRRMHHKILVSDGKYGLVGGINISDRYNDMPGERAWLDFVLFTEGEIVKELCELCWQTWKGFPIKMPKSPCKTWLPEDSKQEVRIRLRRNDWVRKRNQVSSTYFQMFRNAEKEITILCSYFLPGKAIRRLIRRASARGVKISVITAGRSDIKIAKYAERWMYDWLLRYNIELYEYQPSVLHAKVAVCDSNWFTIGSYNVNNISAYASIELNLDVDDKALASKMQDTLNKIIQQDAILVTAELHKKSNSLITQFMRWCAYQTIRFLFFISTFYYAQEK